MSPRTLALVSFSLMTACAPHDDASISADAGPSLSGQPGQSFTFNGAESVGDRWSWRLVATPPGSMLTEHALTDATTAWPSMEPDVPGVYVLEMEVCTQHGDCEVATTAAYVGAQGLAAMTAQKPVLPLVPGGSGADGLSIWNSSNQRPVAIATARQGLRADRMVYLQGDDSYDPDGDTLRYRWSFSSIPAESSLDSTALSGTNGSSTRFTPDVAGTWQVQLTVRDSGLRDTDIVTLETQDDLDPLD